MIEYSIHPAANAFPLIEGDAFDELVANIKANGLFEPIAIQGNVILDGRNRKRACEAAGVAPSYREVAPNTDPVAYIVSHNIHRRHLTTAQRAAIAAELANLSRGGDRKSEQIKGSNDPLIGTSIEEAAKLMNVSPKSVKRAKKTLRDNPEQHEAVKRGETPKPSKTSRAAGDFWLRVASSAYEQETGQKRSDRWLKQTIQPLLETQLEWFTQKEKRSVLNDAQKADVQRVISEYVDSEKAAIAGPIEAQAKETAAALSASAKEKLDTAIRVHKRAADCEFDERVRAEVKRRLDEDVLPTYAKEYERYKTFNDAWRGVFSHEDFKTLRGFLHPDRHPNDPDKAARLFRLVSEKEEVLCGMKESTKKDRPDTLPKTVAELMQRRASKMH